MKSMLVYFFSVIVMQIFATTLISEFPMNDSKRFVFRTQAYIQEPKVWEITADDQSDPCFGHGGVVAYGASWNIATCKSNCQRGLGFRCGSMTYIRCRDGATRIMGIRAGRCPEKNEARSMSADFIFYDNYTIKMMFLNKLPEEENENNNFEIEEDVIIEVAESIFIGGKHYDSFTMKKGTYSVNREEGEYGSVTVNITFD